MPLSPPVDYRPVTWEYYHKLRASDRASLSAGLLWNYRVVELMGYLQTLTLELTTDDSPVGMFEFGITSQGAHAVMVEYFEAGSVTPGTPVVPECLNRNIMHLEPLASMSSGATVDTPGVKFTETYYGSGGVSRSGLVLAPATSYYIVVTNDVDIQDPSPPYVDSINLHMSLIAGRMN